MRFAFRRTMLSSVLFQCCQELTAGLTVQAFYSYCLNCCDKREANHDVCYDSGMQKCCASKRSFCSRTLACRSRLSRIFSVCIALYTLSKICSSCHAATNALWVTSPASSSSCMRSSFLKRVLACFWSRSVFYVLILALFG